MTAESGLEHMPGSQGEFESSTITSNVCGPAYSSSPCIKLLLNSQDPEISEPLPDIALLDAKIAEAVVAIKQAESPGDKRRARERKEDLMRLKRVEQIYVGAFILPPDCLPHTPCLLVPRVPSCPCCLVGCLSY
jgi:hypothetical protein